jgi:predicted MFS family arabinose efflux permease
MVATEVAIDTEPSTAGYRTLLRVPGVPAQVLLGLVAQLTQPVAPIGVVLVIESASGSLELAGLVVAALAVGVAMARPIQGRLIDRRGARPVTTACGLAHCAALLTLVAGAGAGAPGGLLVAVGWAAGVGLPPISQSMRVDLARRTPAGDRTAAYSLVFLTQELSYLLGPLLFGAVVAVGAATLALGVVAGVAGAGALAFAAALGGGGPIPPKAASGVFGPGMLTLFAVVGLLGAAIGAIQVALPALAAGLDRPAMAGVLTAALSLGGILGAIGYGAVAWTARPATRLVVLLAALGLALSPLVALGSLTLIGVALFGCGVALNPALTTISLLVDELAPAAPGEAFGWISTAIGLGLAGGAAAAGVLGQRYGPTRAFVLASGLALAAAAVAAVIRRRRPRPPWRPDLIGAAAS